MTSAAKPPVVNPHPVNPQAATILFVDDEPMACKWFARSFGDEFLIVTAGSVDEAEVMLRERAGELAVLVTDYRMPVRNGLDLLRLVQSEHRHLARLLATAFAEKDVALAAINEGQVFRMLEKPLDGPATRLALRDALLHYRRQAQERALHENRVQAMRETLGFLAHELGTPLATVLGNMGALRERQAADAGEGKAVFVEHRPGEVRTAIDAAERSALYCQSLVTTFVQSARDAYPGAVAQSVTASSLVTALLDEFPFEGGQRAWVSADLQADFALPGRRDLLYLVLCTLTKNALHALRDTPAPSLRIVLGRTADGAASNPWMQFTDNGHGIPADVLAKLTRLPVTTRAHAGGSGMGLIFCRRVMHSIDGAIAVASTPGHGAEVTLTFQPIHEPIPREAHA